MEQSRIVQDTESNEHLYLLEVLVNGLEVFKEGILETFMMIDSNMEIEASQKPKGPTRVLVKFYDFPTIEIQENEFNSSSSNNDEDEDEYKNDDGDEGSSDDKKKVKETNEKSEEDQKSGKSCLFPLAPKCMIEVIKKFPVEVQVYRDESAKEPAHLIGKAKINLEQNFVDVVALANTSVVLPISAAVKSTYDLKNVFSDVTGQIDLLIRLSCFGNTIFTQFNYAQGQKEFKFGTSVQPAKSTIPVDQGPQVETIERMPFFTDEDILELPHGSPSPDVFKMAVPWRKYNDEPPDLKICAPSRLFKEKITPVDEKQQCPMANFNQMFPSGRQPQTSPNCDDSAPSKKCPCFSLMDKMTASRKPGDYGTGTPNALPTNPGTGKGPLEIPPGAKFPCQFGNRWITESQPQAGSNVGNSRRVCCVECVKYPPLEQSYNAKSANENKWSRSNNQFGTEPIKCCVNNSNLVTVPCPAASQDERQDGMKCGLRALADPNQRNLSNLLQPTLFSPECPADSTGRRLSLCTCPKVPAIIPERATGNSVRCECKNILKALKPVDIPDLCPKSQPGSSNNPYADCPPCPPVPINLPPPTADCALAKLLQEAMNDQTSKPVGDPEKLPTTPQFTQPNIRSESGKQVSEPESEVSKDQKSAKTPESPTDPSTATIQQSPTSKPAKTKEKVQKILQEEVDKFDRIQSNDDVSSKLTSLDSESSAPLKRKKRSPKVGKQNETKPPVAQPTPTEKKRDLKYTPTAGIYPGMVIGHRDCIPPVFLVPKNMGWLWNISNTEGYMKPGRGWRPGSIQTNVMNVIDHVKTRQVKDRRAVKNTRAGDHTKKVDSQRAMAPGAGGDAASLFHPQDLTPTFHIHKKANGLMCFSLSPPKPPGPSKKIRRKKANSKGQIVDASSSDESPPVIFTIDPKCPDGPDANPELYETDSTSTNSQDSYVINLTAPSTLRARQPRPICKDITLQVTEEELTAPSGTTVKVEKRASVAQNAPGFRRGKKKFSQVSKRSGNQRTSRQKPTQKV